MEKDIENRIKMDFVNQAQEALELLRNFEQESNFGPRVSRCIVHLSQGNMQKLKETIKQAQIDWRDVIYWAETITYEFNDPFK